MPSLLAALSIMILMLSSGFLLFEDSWAFVLPLNSYFH
jgi:hypothetical protein